MAKIGLKIKRDKSGKEEIGMPEYPSMYLSDVKLPVDKKMIGKMVKAKVTLKFTGYREDNSTKKNHISYDFAIQDIEFINGAVDAVKDVLKKKKQ